MGSDYDKEQGSPRWRLRGLRRADRLATFALIVTAFATVMVMLTGHAIAGEAAALIHEGVRLLDEKLYERAELATRKALDLALAERPTPTSTVAVAHRLLFNIYVATDRQRDAFEVANDNLLFVKKESDYDRLRGHVLAWGTKAFNQPNAVQPKAEDWLFLPGAILMLADAYVMEGKGEEAESLARESLELAQRMHGVHSGEAAAAYIALADAYAVQKKPTLAIPALEQAASIYEDTGLYEEAADVEQEMAQLLRNCGEVDRAAKCEYRAALVRRTGSVFRWIAAWPFGFMGMLSTTLVVAVVGIWLYRRWRRG